MAMLNKRSKETIDLDFKVNDEEVQDTLDSMEETINSIAPNILVRHCENVYITVNHFKGDDDDEK